MNIPSETLNDHPFKKVIATARGPITACVCDASDRLTRVRESTDPVWLQRVIDGPRDIQIAVRKSALTRLRKITKPTT